MLFAWEGSSGSSVGCWRRIVVERERESKVESLGWERIRWVHQWFSWCDWFVKEKDGRDGSIHYNWNGWIRLNARHNEGTSHKI
jgi:hypothetical protein